MKYIVKSKTDVNGLEDEMLGCMVEANSVNDAVEKHIQEVMQSLKEENGLFSSRIPERISDNAIVVNEVDNGTNKISSHYKIYDFVAREATDAEIRGLWRVSYTREVNGEKVICCTDEPMKAWTANEAERRASWDIREKIDNDENRPIDIIRVKIEDEENNDFTASVTYRDYSKVKTSYSDFKASPWEG